MGKTTISADGRFEWDEEKNALNKAKHDMEFHEILSLFDDPYLLERFDRKNARAQEDRFIGIGTIGVLLVVVCCYTERSGRTYIMITTSKLTAERIAEIKAFKTTDFSDCPIQTAEELAEFKLKHSEYVKPVKEAV
jgi:uncharacterized DUF497 family protein